MAGSRLRIEVVRLSDSGFQDLEIGFQLVLVSACCSILSLIALSYNRMLFV